MTNPDTNHLPKTLMQGGPRTVLRALLRHAVPGRNLHTIPLSTVSTSNRFLPLNDPDNGGPDGLPIGLH